MVVTPAACAPAKEAEDLAIGNNIQLYALGLGDVFEEEKLAETVEATGGIYYPTKELELLGDQLIVLVGDLRGQYRLRYLTLRREGVYATRVQIDLPEGTWIFDSQPLDVETFYGLDIKGRLAIDPPTIDTPRGTAQMLVRALRVPRNVKRFRFALGTDKPVDVELVASEDGGLLEGWSSVSRDDLGFFETTSTKPLLFGDSGVLFKITVSGFLEPRLEIPFILDDEIYPATGGFTHPAAIFLGQKIFPSGRIAFRSQRDGNAEIYVMNFDGTEQTRLTNHRDGDFRPAWSPRGDFIAFDSSRNGRSDIYVMTDRGEDPTRFTTHPANDMRPAWSPTGEHIAFDSDRTGDFDVYVMDANDTSTPPRNLTNHPARDWWPAWSPDGKRIAFTSDRDGNQEIYVMDANDPTTPPINLTDHPADDFRPVWSPEGGRIAFFSARDGNREVYVMNADGSGPAQNLTGRSSDDWHPTWSTGDVLSLSPPKLAGGGGHLAFVSFRDGNPEIYIMEDDGEKQRNVTNHPGSDSDPAWGPGSE